MESTNLGILVSGTNNNIKLLVNYINSANTTVQYNIQTITLVNNHINNSLIEEFRKELKQNTSVKNIHIIHPEKYNTKENLDQALANVFIQNKCDFIICSNYTRYLTDSFIQHFSQRILNIHPSILPAFAGTNQYWNNIIKNTLDRQVSLTGISIYLVDNTHMDGSILMQMPLSVSPEESQESLTNKLYTLANTSLVNVLDLYIPAIGNKQHHNIPKESPENSHQQDNKAPNYFDDKQKIYEYKHNNHEAYALCDVGLKRSENMDTVLITPTTELFGVADGVGSAQGGKQTSRLIIRLTEKSWSQLDHKKTSGMKLGTWLRDSIIHNNLDLINWNNTQTEPYDLGSTLNLNLVDTKNNTLYIANVGDSRTYLWRHKTLYRLTKDHTDTTIDNNSNVLAYYIGGEEEDFGIDLYQLPLQSQDILISCTDGLLYLTEDQIAQILFTYLSNNTVPVLKDLSDIFLSELYLVHAPDNIGMVIYKH